MSDDRYNPTPLLSEALERARETFAIDVERLKPLLRTAFQRGAITVRGDLQPSGAPKVIKGAVVPAEYFRDQVPPCAPHLLIYYFPDRAADFVEVRDRCDPRPWPGEFISGAKVRAIDQRIDLYNESRSDDEERIIRTEGYTDRDPSSIPVIPSSKVRLRFPDGSEQPYAGQEFFFTPALLAYGRPDWERNRCVDLAYMVPNRPARSEDGRTGGRCAINLFVRWSAVEDLIIAERVGLGVADALMSSREEPGRPTSRPLVRDEVADALMSSREEPGRPTSRPLVRDEMRRRFENGTLIRNSWRKTAASLATWLAKTHPDEPSMNAETARTDKELTEYYKELMGGN